MLAITILCMTATFVVQLLLHYKIINLRRYFMRVVYFFANTLPAYLQGKDSDRAAEITKKRSKAGIPSFRDFPNYAISSKKIGECQCRIYTPKKKTNDLLFVYLHGGGFCFLSAAFYDNLMKNFVDELNCTIVSIDYPLAPEHVFPTAIEEAYNTIETLMGSLSEIIGFETTNCMIGGDSSGGCLTAVITQKAASCKKDWFKNQILIYPAVGSFNFNSQSYKDHLTTEIRSVQSPRGYANCTMLYLGIKTTDQNREELMRCEEYIPTNLRIDSPFRPFINNVLVSPILAKDDLLKKLPSSITFLAIADILQDEGFAYHMKMKKAGKGNKDISHQFEWIKNSTHGEVSMNLEAARDVVKEVKYWLDKRGYLEY
uniref:Abhydrolase_3 domain-containing protein n=1 Tax=Rhabditophanes sp. KR3021 TaxID=114890 RepID=A0AC35TWP1_9BILA